LSLLVISFLRDYINANTREWDLPPDKSYHFIAHEGGGIDGHTYTNSIEAFERSRKDGFTMFEFDLLMSSDNKLVAVHDWPSFRKNTGNISGEINSPIPHAVVNTSLMHQKYRPITTDEINDFFQKDPALYLITDKSNEFSKILNTFEFHDRIFVECFGELNFIRAVFSGVKRPMFSIGNVNLGENIELAKILLLNVKYVTVGDSSYFKHPKLFDELHSRGIKIFLYTLNDKDKIANAIKRHDAIIYTDDFVFNQPQENTFNFN